MRTIAKRAWKDSFLINAFSLPATEHHGNRHRYSWEEMFNITYSIVLSGLWCTCDNRNNKHHLDKSCCRWTRCNMQFYPWFHIERPYGLFSIWNQCNYNKEFNLYFSNQKFQNKLCENVLNKFYCSTSMGFCNCRLIISVFFINKKLIHNNNYRILIIL